MISEEHALGRILLSRKPIMRFFRYLLFSMIGITAVIGFGASIQPLLPPSIYQKDFLQEFLISKAVLSRINPYLPLPDLTNHFFGSLPVAVAPHPTPHPPPVILLSLPFGLLSYELAAITWLLLEFFCLFFSIFLLLGWFGVQRKLRLTWIVFALMFLWPAVKDELSVGQLMSVLLLLLIIAWIELREGRDVPGGLALGLVIALKLIAWPVCIYLLLKKRFRAVIAAASAAIAVNLAAGSIIGFPATIDYYFKTAGAVTPYYLTFDRNFSIWTIGYRLFRGTFPQLSLGITAPPLYSLPSLALPVSIGFIAFFLVIGVYLALRAPSFDAAFSILICVSILTSPVAWSHYLILTAIPVCVMVQKLFSHKPTNIEINSAIIVLLSLFIGGGFRSLIFTFSGFNPNQALSIHVPFLVSLFTLVPAFAILGLLWLVWSTDHFVRTDSIEESKQPGLELRGIQ